MEKMKLYGWLFTTNLWISAFTFGGGYVVIPMIRKAFVEKRALFGEEELMDMAAIAQSSPGAIAINLSALAGYRAAGLPGAVISCVGAVIPSFVILSLVSLAYAAFRDNALVNAALKGMEAGVAAVIVDLVADMFAAVLKQRIWLRTLMVIAAFLATFAFHVNVVFTLCGCVLLTLLEVAIRRGKAMKSE